MALQFIFPAAAGSVLSYPSMVVPEIVLLTGMSWALREVLICVFLMWKDIEHFKKYLLIMLISFGNPLFSSQPVFCLVFWVLCVLLMPAFTLYSVSFLFCCTEAFLISWGPICWYLALFPDTEFLWSASCAHTLLFFFLQHFQNFRLNVRFLIHLKLIFGRMREYRSSFVLLHVCIQFS